jgi:hypothetical protein
MDHATPRHPSPRAVSSAVVRLVAAAQLVALTLCIACSTKSEAHAVDCMKGVAPTGPMLWFAPEQIPQGAACNDDGAECRFTVAFACGLNGSACPVDGELCTCGSTGKWSCDRESPGLCACVDKPTRQDAAASRSDAASDAEPRDSWSDAGDAEPRD